MSIYKGPQLFEFIGASVRYVFPIGFEKEDRKGLFKRILTENVNLFNRSWKTFIVNSIVGAISLFIIAVLILVF